MQVDPRSSSAVINDNGSPFAIGTMMAVPSSMRATSSAGSLTSGMRGIGEV
jgi:hypothetical protein